ncbi:biotin-dependent carboxyltransferase family protein [Halobacillus sp. ACCC02827]|uniref:5-oxoprolinase subunit C family protein n=1 Tax=Halobacillus sp. ACCC02827 TaxID=3052090 RepID=UPI0025705F6B|nr:biotin-dependent carboxyltransferase family protein [Halobacillus sp. ACCC02827]WJE16539.1 biotin-dependent carboxyltransferase family protein [Halobacillus sp. ACCC02827]
MIQVTKSGLLTTIQDLGRYGFQKHGVIASGVMDKEAHRIANFLVGNDSGEATMEITLLGPVLEFQTDALIAVCGGDLSPMVDGEPLHTWKPAFIKKGSELRFGKPKQGFRSYLAVAGGFDVPEVLNSRSTYLRAGIGGFQGRSLEKGDELPIGELSQKSVHMLQHLKERKHSASFSEANWSTSAEFRLSPSPDEPIRIIKGREYEWFDAESREAILEHTFKIDSKSDRMGYRLKGEKLQQSHKRDMLSEAVMFGTIQVPPEGNPIVLLADRQTTGGYPKIAQVITTDLPKLAQKRPGETISFTLVSHEEAEHLYIDREKQLKLLQQSIQRKFN